MGQNLPFVGRSFVVLRNHEPPFMLMFCIYFVNRELNATSIAAACSAYQSAA